MTPGGDAARRLGERAAAVVRAAFGDGASVTDVEPLKDWERSHVARLHLAGAPLATVIAKRNLGDDAHGFTDWTSLEYLAASPAAAPLVPRFIGGDVAGRLFLMEDLGGSRSLDDVLREPSRAAALTALDALARVSARLHAATRGDDERWFALRTSRPGARPGREVEADLWLDRAAPALGAWIAAFGARPPAGLDAALHAVADSYARPGAWLAFTHGDPAPSNTHLAADGSLRLIDFEYGAPRHALHDVTAWAVLCPLPRDAVAVVRDGYRAESGGAAHFDGAAFDDGWTAMTVWRAVSMLSSIGPDALAADRPWVEQWTRREAALVVAERLRHETVGAPDLAPVATAADAIARAMRARFPEYEGRETIPGWPAFVAP